MQQNLHVLFIHGICHTEQASKHLNTQILQFGKCCAKGTVLTDSISNS